MALFWGFFEVIEEVEFWIIDYPVVKMIKIPKPIHIHYVII